MKEVVILGRWYVATTNLSFSGDGEAVSIQAPIVQNATPQPIGGNTLISTHCNINLIVGGGHLNFAVRVSTAILVLGTTGWWHKGRSREIWPICKSAMAYMTSVSLFDSTLRGMKLTTRRTSTEYRGCILWNKLDFG